MPDGLPWKSAAGGGYIAHPDGEQQPRRFARMTPQTSHAGPWTWWVVYDEWHTGAVAEALQNASESANAVWPRVKAHALACVALPTVKARAAWEEQQLALIYKAQAGRVGPEVFALETTDSADLMWTMEHIEKRPKSPGLELLRQAISSEFRRRRQK